MQTKSPGTPSQPLASSTGELNKMGKDPARRKNSDNSASKVSVSVGSGGKQNPSSGALSDGLETEVSEEIASETPLSNMNSMDPKLMHYTVNDVNGVERAMMEGARAAR